MQATASPTYHCAGQGVDTKTKGARDCWGVMGGRQGRRAPMQSWDGRCQHTGHRILGRGQALHMPHSVPGWQRAA